MTIEVVDEAVSSTTERLVDLDEAEALIGSDMHTGKVIHKIDFDPPWMALGDATVWLEDDHLQTILQEHAQKSYVRESIDFWIEAVRYRRNTKYWSGHSGASAESEDVDLRIAAALDLKRIYNAYCSPDAPEQVCIKSGTLAALQEVVEGANTAEEHIQQTAFDGVLKEVNTTIKKHIFPGFMRTEEYKKNIDYANQLRGCSDAAARSRLRAMFAHLGN